jgi:hypothetical protein
MVSYICLALESLSGGDMADWTRKRIVRRGVIVAFFAIPCIFATIFSVAGATELCCWYKMSHWIDTPAQIVEVRLYMKSTSSGRRIRELDLQHPERPGNRQRYELETEFRYEFEGNTHTATQTLSQGRSSGDLRRIALDLHAHRESLQAFPCYVSPARHDEAVIARDFIGFQWLLAGVLFIGVPVFLFKKTNAIERGRSDRD